MSDGSHEAEHHRRPNKFIVLLACIFGLALGVMGMRTYMQISDAAPLPPSSSEY
jgi:hypothetical protein